MANRVKEDEKNERIIRNLLKLPDNRRCINCNSLGPQYVCTNFSTFVCTTCSGIHREFTHRVKSVSMAKFSPQEVSALQGGGNASAREIYLKEWDLQRNSLPDGSNIERLRDFIKHVFVDRRYTGERNLEKPPRAKMGESEDINGNRRIDTYQGGSRSPPYEDTFERRQSDRRSPGGRSPGYDQDNRQNNDYKKSPARAEVVNDWRREDRFGNGRRSDERSSDGGSKLEARSPDSQRDSDMSSPPVVRPVRDILGDNVSPLRVIEPPKAVGGKSTDGSAHTQRTASSSSLASSEGKPSEIKVVEASFIDFDSVPEPPTTVAVPQTPQAATDAFGVQMTASNNNDWANFDSLPTAASNSMESVLSGLSIPAPTPGPSSGSQGSSFESLFDSIAPTSVLPPSGPPPQVANNTLTGGQWPQLVTPAIDGSLSQKPWNPHVGPNAHGPPVQVGQAEIKPVMGPSFGSATESVGRKALPENLFAMNYAYAPPPVSGWYSGSPYGAAVPNQYNMPMGSWAAPNFQPMSRSANPFDVGSEPAPVQGSTFPSVTSLQGALPNFPTQSGPLRTSSLGTPQPPSYPSPIPPSSYMGQEIAGSMAPRPHGLSGFSFDESAFASMNPNHQMGGLHSAPSNGNPFG